MYKIFILVITVSIGIAGCYYDIEEELYPPVGNCDVTNTSYSSTVSVLLQGNGCLSCHTGMIASGNISLEGYANVQTVALNGKLYGSITHATGFSPMPQGGNKMSACNINKIKAWIDAGAPNN